MKLKRMMAGGDIHLYQVALEKDDYFQVIVDQHGIDLVVELLDPEGRWLFDFDSLEGTFGPEDVSWHAESFGIYRLQARALGKETSVGEYEITFRTRRAATDKDLLRIDSIQAFAKGTRLLREKNLDSTRLAIQKYKDADRGWQLLDSLSQQAEAHLQLGYIYREHLDNFPEALQHYRHAYELLKQTDNIRRQAVALNSIGRTYLLLGKTELARVNYENALRLRKESGDRKGEAITTNDLGLVYDFLGESDKALENYDKAILSATSENRLAQLAVALHNRGHFYSRMGKLQQTFDDLNKALEIREKLGDRQGLATTLSALGMAHRRRNGNHDLEQALKCFRRAYDLSSKERAKREEAVALNNIGLILGDMGLPDQALSNYLKALTIFRDINAQSSIIVTTCNIGYVLSSMGRHQEALAYHTEALKTLRGVTALHLEIMAKFAMAYSQRLAGNYETAIAFLEETIGLLEIWRLGPSSYDLRSTLFASRQNCYDFYIDLLMEMNDRNPDKGFDLKAFNLAERARARTFLEHILQGNSYSPTGENSRLLLRLAALEKRINTRELQRVRLLEEGYKTGQLAAIELETRDLLREHETLRGQLHHSGTSDLPHFLSAQEIQQSVLDPGTALLEYRLGETRGFLWVVSSDRISTFAIPGRATIEDAARRLYDTLAKSFQRKNRIPAKIAAARLANMILDPAEEEIDGKRLLVAADGALHYVPFAALPIPGNRSDLPLIAQHEISLVPSGSALFALRHQGKKRAEPSKTIAVVADPVFQLHDPRLGNDSISDDDNEIVRVEVSRYERLVYSRQEADAILKLVGPGKALSVLGFEANREIIKRGQLSGFRYLHLATHGDLDTQRPELTRLVFSLFDKNGQPQNGFLHAHEIYNLRLPADLIVLSACQTALGQAIRGEGLVGLTQAFLHAGAARVLVSLWQVNDRAAAELMANLYRHLLVDGLEPAAALRQAQLDVLRVKAWQSPYYWAGFSLHGES